MKEEKATTAEAIWETLRSVNVSDSNFEPANVVDALHEVSISIARVAWAIRHSKFGSLYPDEEE